MTRAEGREDERGKKGVLTSNVTRGRIVILSSRSQISQGHAEHRIK